jgi:hypothetical protein
MTDYVQRPLYKELRRVFLDSWNDANGWASMLRMVVRCLTREANATEP